jgi:mono/diheme cytochrome c family protein
MNRPTNRLMTLALGLLVAAPWGPPADAAEPAYKPRPKGSLTFTKDIAPVIFKNCAVCHRPGEVAPFSLLSYRDVKKRDTLIQTVTENRYMPPWKPVSGHGEFKDERRLTSDQIGMLKQWVEEGAAEGDAKRLPPAPKFADGWQLGKPDLVVTLPKAYTVPAEGADIYRNFAIPVKIPKGKYIRATEFHPGNRRVVHHAGLAMDPLGVARKQDGKDGAPGFTQTTIPGILFPGSMSFWVPGKDPRPLPEGFALEWQEGADLVVQLHLHPSGKPEVEQSTIGLYFTNTPPRRKMASHVFSYDKINIPPGDKAYRTKQTHTLPNDVELYGIFPHMHMIGKEVTVTATLPGGVRKSLLRIDAWDFNWQNYYEYAAPVALPKGTQLVMETVHDNSATNPVNPFNPPRRITYGLQTTNEMAAMFLDVVPRQGVESDKPRTDADLLKEAKDLVRRYDKDGDGKLSPEELAKIPGVSAMNIKELVKKFDKDGDGKLDAAEIVEALKALKKR